MFAAAQDTMLAENRVARMWELYIVIRLLAACLMFFSTSVWGLAASGTAPALDALKSGRYEEAQRAYTAIVEKKPTDAEAWHGLSIAHFLLDNDTAAAKAMAEVHRLAPKPTRALVHNSAAVHLDAGLSMVAAGEVMDYLKATPDPLDEPLQNVLGYALSQAESEESIPLAKLDAARRFYAEYDARLNAVIPEKKRWGNTWVSAQEANNFHAAWRKAEVASRALMDEIATMKRQLADANRDVARAKEAARRNPKNPKKREELSEAQQQAVQFQSTSRVKQTDLARIQSEQPAAPFADSVRAIAPDRNTPPAVGEPEVYLTPASEIVSKPEPEIPSTEKPVRPTPNATPTGPVKPIRILTAAFPISHELYVSADAMLQGAGDLQIRGQQQPNARLTIVRRDAKLGVALLRITGDRVAFLNLADKASPGQVQCIGFPTDSIFDATAEPIAGNAKLENDRMQIITDRAVGAVGGPVISKGKVVGVILSVDKEDATLIHALPVEKLREFLGDDLPKSSSVQPDPSTIVVRIGPRE